MGADGQELDVYMNPDTSTDKIFRIRQLNVKTQEFDEYKIMLNFESIDDATAGYLKNYPKDWKGFWWYRGNNFRGYKMKNKTKAVLLLLTLLVVTSFYAGHELHRYKTQEDLKLVVDWNTKQIHSLGIAAATDSYNAEVMIQILNLIEGQEVKPPVRGVISDMITSDQPIEDDDVPHTFEQVSRDQSRGRSIN